MWAVLPAKNIVDAKQRLAEALRPAERRTLFRLMYENALSVLSSARGLDGIAVVTCDPAAAEIAESFGARLITEPANDGQTAAVERAAKTLAAEGARGILTIPGDTPLISAAEVERVLDAHGDPPAMTIVPAHDRRGSNCIAVSPPDLIPFSFGNDSFQPHLAAARERGVEPRVLPLPGLGLDIDTPEDLRALLRRPEANPVCDFLNDSGIAERFLADREQALEDVS